MSGVEPKKKWKMDIGMYGKLKQCVSKEGKGIKLHSCSCIRLLAFELMRNIDTRIECKYLSSCPFK